MTLRWYTHTKSSYTHQTSKDVRLQTRTQDVNKQDKNPLMRAYSIWTRISLVWRGSDDRRMTRYEGNACSSDVRWEKMPSECRDKITRARAGSHRKLDATGNNDLRMWSTETLHGDARFITHTATLSTFFSSCLAWVLIDHAMMIWEFCESLYSCIWCKIRIFVRF